MRNRFRIFEVSTSSGDVENTTKQMENLDLKNGLSPAQKWTPGRGTGPEEIKSPGTPSMLCDRGKKRWGEEEIM